MSKAEIVETVELGPAREAELVREGKARGCCKSWWLRWMGDHSYEKVADSIFGGDAAFEATTRSQNFFWTYCAKILWKSVVVTGLALVLFLIAMESQVELGLPSTAVDIPKQAAIAMELARFDCEDGYNFWHRTWPPLKKAWCCLRHARGCLPSSTTFDCQAGFSDLRPAWSDEQKAWCCQQQGVGCMAGCDAGCSVKGNTSTCKDSIQQVATDMYQNRIDACHLAYEWVLKECQFCSSCWLHEANCRTGAG